MKFRALTLRRTRLTGGSMIPRSAAVLVLSLTLVGCFSSVRVRRSASLSENPQGIPFYAKTSVCKQQTVWVEPQYTLSYEAKDVGVPFGPVEKVLNRKDYLQKSVQDFIAAPDSPSKWKEIVFDFARPNFNQRRGSQPNCGRRNRPELDPSFQYRHGGSSGGLR